MICKLGIVERDERVQVSIFRKRSNVWERDFVGRVTRGANASKSESECVYG